jgi:hypothetical protein
VQPAVVQAVYHLNAALAVEVRGVSNEFMFTIEKKYYVESSVATAIRSAAATTNLTATASLVLQHYDDDERTLPARLNVNHKGVVSLVLQRELAAELGLVPGGLTPLHHASLVVGMDGALRLAPRPRGAFVVAPLEQPKLSADMLAGHLQVRHSGIPCNVVCLLLLTCAVCIGTSLLRAAPVVVWCVAWASAQPRHTTYNSPAATTAGGASAWPGLAWPGNQPRSVERELNALLTRILKWKCQHGIWVVGLVWVVHTYLPCLLCAPAACSVLVAPLHRRLLLHSLRLLHHHPLLRHLRLCLPLGQQTPCCMQRVLR